MRLLFAGSSIAAGLMMIFAASSCSSFGTGDTGSSSVDAARTEDAPAPTTDGPSVQEGSAGDGGPTDPITSCNGKQPILNVTPNVQLIQSSFITEDNGGELTLVPGSDAGFGGPFVRGAGIPPDTSTADGTRAFATWTYPIAGPISSARLDYTYRATYNGTKLFAEGGCRLSLKKGGKKGTTGLVFSPGAVQIGGRSSNDATYRNMPPNIANIGWNNSPRRLEVNVAIDVPEANRATVTVNAFPGTTSTAVFMIEKPIDAVDVDCGIIFADNSDENVLTIEVAKVTLTVCGP